MHLISHHVTEGDQNINFICCKDKATSKRTGVHTFNLLAHKACSFSLSTVTTYRGRRLTHRGILLSSGFSNSINSSRNAFSLRNMTTEKKSQLTCHAIYLSRQDLPPLKLSVIQQQFLLLIWQLYNGTGVIPPTLDLYSPKLLQPVHVFSDYRLQLELQNWMVVSGAVTLYEDPIRAPDSDQHEALCSLDIRIPLG